MSDRISVKGIEPIEDRPEPPIIGTVPCIACGSSIPINALQSFNVQRMCKACKQAILAMKMQMELNKTTP